MISGFVAHLWQSTLFVGAVWFLALALRKNPARVRYSIWFIASAKFLIPFSLLVGLGAFVPRRAVSPPAETGWVAAAEQVRPLVTIPAVGAEVARTVTAANGAYFTLAAVFLWFCGFAAIAICWAARWKRMGELRRRARPLRVLKCPESAVPIMSASGLVEPGVFGVFRPVLLLPEGIGARLNEAQLDAILDHELCHVRRRDNLTAAIHMVVQAVFWFHPLVWWLGARLVDERERACDEEVLRLGNTPHVYAEGILNVCKLYVESPLACVAGVTGADLKKRIEAIMKNRVGQRLNLARKLLLAGAGVVAAAGPLVIGIGHAPAINAQSSSAARSDTAAFEVASIKASSPNDGSYTRGCRGGPGTSDPGLWRCTNATVSMLVMLGYDIRRYQLTAPDWTFNTNYEIDAKLQVGATKMQFREMIENLLADRFKLQFHWIKKEMPMYELVVAKGGSKLRESVDQPAGAEKGNPPAQSRTDAEGYPNIPKECRGCMGINSGKARYSSTRESVKNFADMLAGQLNMPVRDRTELTGHYDITLSWSSGGGVSQRANEDSTTEPGMTMETAVQQQLGLRLVRARGSVDVIVVDGAQESPKEN